MYNFKPGQKVIFKRKATVTPYDPSVDNWPEDNQRVVLKCEPLFGMWIVEGFELTKCKTHRQAMHADFFQPLPNADLYVKLEPQKLVHEFLIIKN